MPLNGRKKAQREELRLDRIRGDNGCGRRTEMTAARALLPCRPSHLSFKRPPHLIIVISGVSAADETRRTKHFLWARASRSRLSKDFPRRGLPSHSYYMKVQPVPWIKRGASKYDNHDTPLLSKILSSNQRDKSKRTSNKQAGIGIKLSGSFE